MVSIERLLERYGHKEYPLYGDCICVPGTDWVLRWDEDLKRMGYTSIKTDFGNPNRPAYLIQLKEGDAPEGTTKEEASVSSEEAPVTEEKKGDYKRGRWSGKDKQKLFKLMDAAAGSVEEKAKAVLKEFPGRPLHSLLREYSKLVPSDQIGVSSSGSTEETGSTQEEKTEEKQTTEQKPTKEKRTQRRKEEPTGQAEEKEPIKTNLACNVTIHIEAKSAASIKAVITLLKELK